MEDWPDESLEQIVIQAITWNIENSIAKRTSIEAGQLAVFLLKARAIKRLSENLSNDAEQE